MVKAALHTKIKVDPCYEDRYIYDVRFVRRNEYGVVNVGIEDQSTCVSLSHGDVARY